ncbi:MAG: 50S ribosomal protein L25/general stress protein Ctc [Aeromicrobium sp.]|uniref:50S ribosomal protein L25/general stress protein Ctc n=1 Tax=Aeromicrobium sp. TaxID=1871063 RepID=UPI0039E38B4A
MSEITLSAQPRTEFGKGAARRARREGLVPGVLYGHGTDPVHVNLPGHDLMLALKQSNALLSIEVEGADKHLVIPKQVQRDPLKGFLEHVDLLIVKRGEKVTVDVPITIVGEVTSDLLVVTENTTVSLEAEATAIPNDIEVSVTGLEADAQVLAKDLALPSGATLASEDDLLIVKIAAAGGSAETADAGEGAAEEAADGE